MPATVQPFAAPHADTLARLATLAGTLGLQDVVEDSGTLATRISEGRFFVACLGQFKRGKSTLLNALVGEPVLPTGVVPVTSMVTVLRYGAQRRARVRRIRGDWEEIGVADLGSYVSEAENPANVKGIAGVEVFLPHPLLGDGLCLVDTPGLGSVFTSATGATLAFVPHIDAALFVLGADPPISADELDLVEEAARHVGDLLFVLAKADKFSHAERDEARAFSERVLGQRLARPVAPLIEVSAAERLAGGRGTNGWDELCGRLATLASRSGRALVLAAEVRGIEAIAGRLMHEVAEREDSLRRPLGESAARIESLRQDVREAERSLDDLHYQLLGEHERLAAALLRELEAFLKDAIPEARAELRAVLERCRDLRAAALFDEAARGAQDIARCILDRWLQEEAARAEERYRRASRRFVDAGNSLLSRVVSSGTVPPPRSLRMVEHETGFRVRGDLRYTELLRLATPSPLVQAVSRALPGRLRLATVVRRAGDYLERLVFTNANRVANGLIEQSRLSRERLESDLRRQLGEIVRAAERALEQARDVLAQGADAVHAEIGRLQAIRDEVAALTRVQMAGDAGSPTVSGGRR